VRAVALALLVCVLAAGPTAAAPVTGAVGEPTRPGTPGAPNGSTTTTDGPRIVAVAPDPVADGDRGEFVVLRIPRGTNRSGLTLVDGEDRIPLEAVGRATGRIALSADPRAARVPPGTPVAAAPLSLANGGERLRLLRDGRTVDVLRYADAPEGSLRTADGWRPIGATSFRPARTGGGTARAFVLPDAPGAAVAPLANASRRILLAGYALSDRRVRERLLAAADRGVRVRVLVEGGPVGGITRRAARTLDALARGGVGVRVVDGPYARYEFHHAKYAVVDDRAVVLTENWKPAGTGGRSSRGWGVVLDDPAATGALARTFRADWTYQAARPWPAWREGRLFRAVPAANGTYPARIAPARVPVERATVLIAPDNAENAVLDRFDGATESIRLVGADLGRDSPFARALVRAARRGVRVRVLLSGGWHAREENRRVAERLNDRARRRDLPLTVELADPGGRFEKIHAKGAIVDGRTVLVGSMNWNTHAARENREVVLALEGSAVARYYREVFRADWQGGGRGRLPVGILAVVALAALLALLIARRVTAGGGRDDPPGGW
jgi:phosphatidylserine/phosphatidylglycerophosphate/cardiolipin synthase-like enzyme